MRNDDLATPFLLFFVELFATYSEYFFFTHDPRQTHGSQTPHLPGSGSVDDGGGGGGGGGAATRDEAAVGSAAGTRKSRSNTLGVYIANASERGSARETPSTASMPQRLSACFDANLFVNQIKAKSLRRFLRDQ